MSNCQHHRDPTGEHSVDGAELADHTLCPRLGIEHSVEFVQVLYRFDRGAEKDCLARWCKTLGPIGPGTMRQSGIEEDRIALVERELDVGREVPGFSDSIEVEVGLSSTRAEIVARSSSMSTASAENHHSRSIVTVPGLGS